MHVHVCEYMYTYTLLCSVVVSVHTKKLVGLVTQFIGQVCMCMYTHIMYVYVYTLTQYVYVYTHSMCVYIRIHEEACGPGDAVYRTGMYVYVYIYTHNVCVCIYTYTVRVCTYT